MPGRRSGGLRAALAALALVLAGVVAPLIEAAEVARNSPPVAELPEHHRVLQRVVDEALVRATPAAVDRDALDVLLRAWRDLFRFSPEQPEDESAPPVI